MYKGPIGFIFDSTKNTLKALPKAFKNPKLLVGFIIMAALWVTFSYLKLSHPDNSFIYWASIILFAQGGMFGGTLGSIGGIIGKSFYSWFINSIILPIFVKSRRQRDKSPKILFSSRNFLTELLIGLGLALVIFAFLSGNARFENSMIGLIAFGSSFRAIRNNNGFLKGFIRSFSKGRLSPAEAGNVVLGLSLGFALSLALVSRIGQVLYYYIGLGALIVAILINLLVNNRKAPAFIALLAILISGLSLYSPLLTSSNQTFRHSRETDRYIIEYEHIRNSGSLTFTPKFTDEISDLVLNYEISGVNVTSVGFSGDMVITVYGTVRRGSSVTLKAWSDGFEYKGRHDFGGSSSTLDANIYRAERRINPQSILASDEDEEKFSFPNEGNVRVSVSSGSDQNYGVYFRTVLESSVMYMSGSTEKRSIAVNGEFTIDDSSPTTTSPTTGSTSSNDPSDSPKSSDDGHIPKDRMPMVHILSILGGMLGLGAALGSVGPNPEPPIDPNLKDGVYDFGDGREYREGHTYTFDDGHTYQLQNGQFIKIGSLAEGQTYQNPDGDQKIWVGDQPWQLSDWQNQSAINDQYARDHAAAWAIDSTTPDRHMEEAFRDISQREQTYEALGRMKEAAKRNDMAGLGSLDDMHTRISDITDKMDRGEAIDYDSIARIRDYMQGRLDGSIITENQLPMREMLNGWFDKALLKEALLESGRNLTQCATSDGKMSWAGLGIRIGAGVLSGGASEWLLRPIGSLYTINDAIQSGYSGLGAYGLAVLQVGLAEALGRGLSFGYAGITQGREGLNAWVNEQARQISDLASYEAWKNTGSKLTDSLFGRLLNGPPPMNSVEAYHLDRIGKFRASGKFDSFQKAVQSGDAKALLEVYKNGGMKDLALMQQKGYISSSMASKANQLLANEVNSAITSGTKDALKKTFEQTGVRIDELIVGDSGSGAKGPVTRMLTDADRTLIPRFNEADFSNFVKRTGMSREKAYQYLSNKLHSNHCNSVELRLNANGITSKDVGFSSYNQIGYGSGQSDAYGSGFTNSRQSTMGTANVYRPDSKGDFRIHKTSGQSAVDQNILNQKSYSGSSVPNSPTKMSIHEAPSTIKSQVKNVASSPNDPTTVSKALGRADKASSLLKNSGKVTQTISDNNSKLVDMAKQIYEDPGKLNQVLQNNDMTLQDFLSQGIDAVTDYSKSISNINI